MRIKTFEIRIDPMTRERDERVVNDFLGAVRVSRLHCGCLRSRGSWAVMVIYNEQPGDAAALRAVQIGDFLPDGEELTPQECERFMALRTWRNDRAAAMGHKPFVIASNRDLLNVARSDVETPDDLLSIAGFGPRKVERYGEEIIAVLDSVAEGVSGLASAPVCE